MATIAFFRKSRDNSVILRFSDGSNQKPFEYTTALSVGETEWKKYWKPSASEFDLNWVQGYSMNQVIWKLKGALANVYQALVQEDEFGRVTRPAIQDVQVAFFESIGHTPKRLVEQSGEARIRMNEAEKLNATLPELGAKYVAAHTSLSKGTKFQYERVVACLQEFEACRGQKLFLDKLSKSTYQQFKEFLVLPESKDPRTTGKYYLNSTANDMLSLSRTFVEFFQDEYPHMLNSWAKGPNWPHQQTPIFQKNEDIEKLRNVDFAAALLNFYCAGVKALRNKIELAELAGVLGRKPRIVMGVLRKASVRPIDGLAHGKARSAQNPVFSKEHILQWLETAGASYVSNKEATRVRVLTEARDWYCFLCEVPMRVGDFLRVTRTQLQYELKNGRQTQILSWIAEKNKTQVRIPLTDYALHIWHKYEGQKDGRLTSYRNKGTLNLNIKRAFEVSGLFSYEVDTYEHRGYDLVATKQPMFQLVSPHSARHTFATHKIAIGVPRNYVAKYLGHKSTSTVEIYTHIIDDRLVEFMLGDIEEIKKRDKIQRWVA